MPWYSPPTRREVSLVLFSLATFVLFYNLETSFTTGSEQKSHKNIGDASWDDVIYGNWTWEEQQVADNAQKQAHDKQPSDPIVVSFQPSIFGTVGVNDGILDWDNKIPTTAVLKHVPGHTVMDNVFVLNGTLFVVTDDPAFPSLDSIASAGDDAQAAPAPSDWQLLSSAEAREMLGPFGGVIHGVSWLVTEPSPSNYTLFALWRTYSALDTSLSPETLTLPPPRRLFFPNVPTFMGQRPDLNGPIVLRTRSPCGIHPTLAKSALPTLGLLFAEDWTDFALLHVPYLLKRVVLVDEGAARRARADVPAFAIPLRELEGSKAWWEPMRRAVVSAVGLPEEVPKKGWFGTQWTVVTYLARQDAWWGARLREGDHEGLIRALGELGAGYEVRVVDAGATWTERMRAIAQSTVVIGVYGDHMADCVYVPPSGRTTVMEIFPSGVFVPDAQIAVGAVDVRYVAWRDGRRYDVDALPPVTRPAEEENNDVPVDVGALVQAIRHIA